MKFTKLLPHILILLVASVACGGSEEGEATSESEIWFRWFPGVAPGDFDGDTIKDVFDNCPRESNLQQSDGDTDGVGDACEAPIVFEAATSSSPANGVKIVQGRRRQVVAALVNAAGELALHENLHGTTTTRRVLNTELDPADEYEFIRVLNFERHRRFPRIEHFFGTVLVRHRTNNTESAILFKLGGRLQLQNSETGLTPDGVFAIDRFGSYAFARRFSSCVFGPTGLLCQEGVSITERGPNNQPLGNSTVAGIPIFPQSLKNRQAVALTYGPASELWILQHTYEEFFDGSAPLNSVELRKIDVARRQDPNLYLNPAQIIPQNLFSSSAIACPATGIDPQTCFAFSGMFLSPQSGRLIWRADLVIDSFANEKTLVTQVALPQISTGQTDNHYYVSYNGLPSETFSETNADGLAIARLPSRPFRRHSGEIQLLIKPGFIVGPSWALVRIKPLSTSPSEITYEPIDWDGEITDFGVSAVRPDNHIYLAGNDGTKYVAQLIGARVDVDGDGYVDTLAGGDDCNDNDPNINPGAAEACDGVDNDCDPSTTEDGIISVNGLGAYTQLQEAVDAAEAGAELTLCDGTFDEQVAVSRTITFRSRNGSSATSWTASAGGPALSASAGDITLDGITFSGTEGTIVSGPIPMWGGAVALRGAESAVVRNCVFEDNGVVPDEAVDAWGGAIGGPFDGLLHVESSTFTGNRATNGGALAHEGELVLLRVHLEDNTAVSGGALVLVGDGRASTADATGSTLIGNHAQLGGAALLFAPDGGSVEWSGGLIADNVAEHAVARAVGGGMYLEVQGTGTARLSEVAFTGNSADRGGGIYIHGYDSEATTVELSTMAFVGNTATLGGGVYAVCTDGTGTPQIAVTKLLNIVATNVYVGTNSADQGGGIGLRTNHGELVWEGGTVSGNSASVAGGGVYLWPTSLYSGFTVRGVDIQSNTAPVGGGFHLSNGNIVLENLTLADMTVVNNVATTAGGGIYTNVVRMGPSSNLTLSGNSAPSGAAWTALSTNVDLSNSAFIANAATDDAAIVLDGEFYRLQGTNLTFGTGADANTPIALITDYGGTETWDLSGVIATILCEWDTSPDCSF